MNDNHLTPDPEDLGDLADLDEREAATAARLRRTLHAVAAATPTQDRSAALLAAIDTPAPSEEDDAMHLDPHDQPADHRPLWRRPLVLAAAAAVLVAAIVGFALDAGRDEAVQIDPAGPDDGPATGWFIPPEGWEIVEVRTDFLDVGETGACPCRVMVAAGEGQDPAGLVVHETTAAPDMEGTPVDVDGRPGLIVDAGVQGLVVGSGDRHLVLFASGVDGDSVLQVADAWLDRLDAGQDVVAADLPLPEGMTAGAIVASPARRSVHVVDVTAVESATGRRTYYQLIPAGYYSALVIDSAAITRRDGQFEVTTSIGDTPLLGLVGGPVEVAVGPSFFAEEGDPLSVAELQAFLSGLRHVSVEVWDAALDSAEVEPEIVDADSLFGPPLVDGPVDG